MLHDEKPAASLPSRGLQPATAEALKRTSAVRAPPAAAGRFLRSGVERVESGLGISASPEVKKEGVAWTSTASMSGIWR